MPTPEPAVQDELVRQIKDSRWDVRGYFSELFQQLMPTELLQHPRLAVVDELLTEDTLAGALDKSYEKEGYAILFYTHKTHSQMVSPFNDDKTPSHTSLLVCKVEHGRINGVLNVDGYHCLSYMDIISERLGAKPNPLIAQRMIVAAPDIGATQHQPLQSPSWNNLNCVLYTFAFAKAIAHAFAVLPDVLDGLFVGQNLAKAGLNDLQEVILNGVDGSYTRRVGNAMYRDSAAAIRHHAEVREALASTIQARFACANEVLERVIEPVAVFSPSPVVNGQVIQFPAEGVAPALISDVAVEEPVAQASAQSGANVVVFPGIESAAVSVGNAKEFDAEQAANVLRQSVAAIDAVENRVPTPTPCLFTRFVNSIANMLKSICNALGDFFDSIATRIGLKG